jgi:superfamily II DNA/RNA helicase
VAGFSDFDISPNLVQALEKQGLTKPFEVQVETIPEAMLGKDICCRAPTGSGKTLAFGLPLLERSKKAKSKHPTSLILTPTRELAEQIRNVLSPLAKSVDRDVISIYGGTPYQPQLRGLKNGVDIVVACPGRLLDLLDRDSLSLEHVDVVVVDEADRMADMGFIKPVRSILDKCSKKCQTVMFSATLDNEVSEIVRRYQKNPVNIRVGPEDIGIESMRHLFWTMKDHGKVTIAVEVINKCGRSMLFCRTRRGVDKLGKKMYEAGISNSVLHGGLKQGQRDRSMKEFGSGKSIALICTDVAARGIDIEGVNCIIHYDPPENGKAYKHRSGRTARAGSEGLVVSFVQKSQQREYGKIQREAGIDYRFKSPDIGSLPQLDFEPGELNKKGNSNKGRGSRRRRRDGPPRRGKGGPPRRGKGGPPRRGKGGPPRRGKGRSSKKRGRRSSKKR